MALKGVAITIQYTAWDTSANAPKTGDAANHTLKVIKDGTAATPTNSPSEVDATNCPGVYKLALTAAEMGYNTVSVAGKSSTASVAIIPIHITTEGGNLDAAVSSRAPESGGNVAAVKAKTDNLPASPAAVGSAMTLTSAYDAAKTAAPESGGNVAAIKAKTDNLPSDPASNTQVNTRLATSGYTAPDNTDIVAIKARTDNLPASPAATGDIPAAATIAAAVWGNASRTLTSFGSLVADIWAYATRTLSSFGALAADVWSVGTRSLTDKTGFTISGTKQTLDALQDLSQAGAQAGATAALNAYDPPTKAEMGAALAALHDISVGELLAGDLSDSLSFPANSLADRLRKLFWILCNRMAIVDATGAFTAYKGDGATPGATGTITDNGTNTVRSAPTWP